MDRPLEGVRVVEVAMWVAGPSTTAVLGDWGADVIKLEDPVTGDPIRGFVTRTMGDPSARIRPPFELDNRNKRSVAVDLRRPDGHVFALKLIEHADVFVTSLRLDAIERMKLDYATLARRKIRGSSMRRSTATGIADPIAIALPTTTPPRGRARG